MGLIGLWHHVSPGLQSVLTHPPTMSLAGPFSADAGDPWDLGRQGLTTPTSPAFQASEVAEKPGPPTWRNPFPLGLFLNPVGMFGSVGQYVIKPVVLKLCSLDQQHPYPLGTY